MKKLFLGGLRSHWNGQLPLWIALICVGIGAILIIRIFNFGLSVSEGVLTSGVDAPYRLIGRTILSQAFTIPILIWWWMGAWRSASRSASRHFYWSGIAKVVICIAILAQILLIALIVCPNVMDAVSDIEGDPRQGSRWISVLPRTNEVEVHGFISRSLADTLAAEVTAHPKKVIVLDSRGGRIAPALQMKKLIRRLGLNTLVVGECDSACVDIFLGGKKRYMLEGAKLGFHSTTNPGGASDAADKAVEDEAISSGVSRAFIVKATSRRDIWFPSNDELKKGGVVTAILPASGRRSVPAN